MKLSGGVVLMVLWVVSVSGSRSCPETCKSRKNPDRPTCNTDTGVCSRGCVPGYHGDTCNRKCDVNCEGGTCQRRDGSCTCKLGYTFITGTCGSHKGVKCESNDHCLNDRCLSAGRLDCLEGCKPGWFGQYCKETCPANCFCDKESGNCTSCISGSYGIFCSQKCHKCTENVCAMITGECIKECTSGYHGSFCNLTCATCIDGTCNDATGECTKGCTSGYHGSFCNLTCKNCKDGDCDQDTGECSHKDEKEEFSSVQSWVGGGVAVVVLIIIAVGFYMFRRLKRMHGVVYEAVKWRRRTPSVQQDARAAPAPGHIQLKEEVSTTPPSVCKIQPTRQTSYLIPRLSGSGHNLQVQPQFQAAGVADQQEEELQAAAAPPSHSLLHDLQRSSDDFDRPGSYTLPSYIEINEELMDHLPQPPQGAAAPAPVVNNSSFSVVADVHATDQVINIPLIAESFDPPEPGDSSPDWEPPPDVVNYDHPFPEVKPRKDQAVLSGCKQIDDKSKSIPLSECPLNIARPASYIEPKNTVSTQQHMLSPGVSDQHSDVTAPTQQHMLSPSVSDQHSDVRVPTQQHMLSPRVSDQHSDDTVPTQQHMLSTSVPDQQQDEPEATAAPPPDRLLQDDLMATLPQPPQGAEAPAPVVDNSSSLQ